MLFYASLAVLTLWTILKSAGIINTPPWLAFGVPLAGLIISLLSFYQNIMDKINQIAVGLATLTTRVNHLDTDLNGIKNKLDRVDSDIHRIRFAIAGTKSA